MTYISIIAYHNRLWTDIGWHLYQSSWEMSTQGLYYPLLASGGIDHPPPGLKSPDPNRSRITYSSPLQGWSNLSIRKSRVCFIIVATNAAWQQIVHIDCHGFNRYDVTGLKKEKGRPRRHSWQNTPPGFKTNREHHNRFWRRVHRGNSFLDKEQWEPTLPLSWRRTGEERLGRQGKTEGRRRKDPL